MSLWFPIPGFSKYEIDERGNVRVSPNAISRPTGRPLIPGRLLKPTVSNAGYLTLTISDDDHKIRWVQIHVLVALTFYGPKPSAKHKALHWDDQPLNNHKDNIRWGTNKENGEDAKRNGRVRKPRSFYEGNRL